MKILIAITILISLNGCATWWGGIKGFFLGLTGTTATVSREVKKQFSPYEYVEVEECKGTWWGGKKCEKKWKYRRKDLEPLTQEENRRLNGD